MSNQQWEASDKTKKTVRYISYAIIAFYGLIAAELFEAIIVIALFQILTELKRHRYQRALIFEQEREIRKTDQNESAKSEQSNPVS